jgi:hypothetical protein
VGSRLSRLPQTNSFTAFAAELGMPLFTRSEPTVATATLVFDHPDATYDEGEPITFTVEVDAPMDAQHQDATFEGHVRVPLIGNLPVSGTAHVVTPAGTYGPFEADGFTVVQDPDNPARFHATPAA